MKKTICLAIACLLLLALCSCNLMPDQNGGRLSGRIESALAAHQQTATDPTTRPVVSQSTSQPTETVKPTGQTQTRPVESTKEQEPDEHWAELLAGWWVDMDAYGEPVEYPEVFYFTHDGYVFINPDDWYSYAEYGLEPDFHHKWAVEDGKLQFFEYDGLSSTEPLVCSLEIDDAGAMFIFRPNGTFYFLEPATSPGATRILLASSYSWLAENARIGLIRLGSNHEPAEGVVVAFIDEKIMVAASDQEMIDYYDLHDADFDNDYEIIDDEERYYPHLIITENDFTAFRLVDYSDEYFITEKTASYAEFRQAVLAHGMDGMMVRYSLTPDKAYLAAISEMYLP